MGVTMLHVPTPSQTKFAQRHRNFHQSISARAAKIAPPVKAPYVQRKHAINPVPYWRDMWFYSLVRFGETYVPRPAPGNRIEVRTIQEVVAKHYGLKLADILGKSRKADVILPRHVAMYLAKEITGRSFPELGRRFAGRDHTTVLSAIRKIERILKTDEDLRGQVSQISESIGEFARSA